MSNPNVSGVVTRFASNIVFRFARKQVVDGILSETEIAEKVVRGSIQPIPPRKLLIKPEGQRSWRWWTLWTKQPLPIDVIVVDDKGVEYRAMSISDYSRNGGFYEVELAEGVQP